MSRENILVVSIRGMRAKQENEGREKKQNVNLHEKSHAKKLG